MGNLAAETYFFYSLKDFKEFLATFFNSLQAISDNIVRNYFFLDGEDNSKFWEIYGDFTDVLNEFEREVKSIIDEVSFTGLMYILSYFSKKLLKILDDLSFYGFFDINKVGINKGFEDMKFLASFFN